MSHYEEGFGLKNKLEELPESMDELIENAMEKIKFTMHDDIVRKTRRILAMEQFRNERIAELTSRYHLENLQEMYTGIFMGFMEKGILKKDDPELIALEFVSPVSLLIHMYDRQPEREEEVLNKIRKHFEHFAKVYAERWQALTKAMKWKKKDRKWKIMEKKENMIAIDHLNKSFGTVKAVNDLSFRVKKAY